MAGEAPGSALRNALEESGAPRTRVDPRTVEAMNAEPADDAFTKDGWIFELKLDGYRLIASKSGGEALLLTRNGNDYTGVFPEIARAVKALPVDECIIDGEVVVCDPKGLPSFALLQRRGRLSSPIDIKRAAVELPATFFRIRSAGVRGFRSPAAASAEAKGIPGGGRPENRPASRARSHRARRRSVSRAGGGDGARRRHRQKSRRSLSQGTLGPVAQDQAGEDRRLRNRRIHGAKAEPNEYRRAAARGQGGRNARLRRQSGHGIQRCAAERAQGNARSDNPSRRTVRRAVHCAGRRAARRATTFPRRPRQRGSIRCTCARCAFANGRRTECCDIRRSCDSGTTRVRTNASARVGPLSSSRPLPRLLLTPSCHRRRQKPRSRRPSTSPT